MGWSAERFASIAACSHALHGNKHMLPVAVAIHESAADVVKAPDIGLAIGGHMPANKVLDALGRLCVLGALKELPYPGRPHARMFELRDSAYWVFIGPFVAEARSAEAASAHDD